MHTWQGCGWTSHYEPLSLGSEHANESNDKMYRTFLYPRLSCVTSWKCGTTRTYNNTSADACVSICQSCGGLELRLMGDGVWSPPASKNPLHGAASLWALWIVLGHLEVQTFFKSVCRDCREVSRLCKLWVEIEGIARMRKNNKLKKKPAKLLLYYCHVHCCGDDTLSYFIGGVNRSNWTGELTKVTITKNWRRTISNARIMKRLCQRGKRRNVRNTTEQRKTRVIRYLHKKSRCAIFSYTPAKQHKRLRNPRKAREWEKRVAGRPTGYLIDKGIREVAKRRTWAAAYKVLGHLQFWKNAREDSRCTPPS